MSNIRAPSPADEAMALSAYRAASEAVWSIYTVAPGAEFSARETLRQAGRKASVPAVPAHVRRRGRGGQSVMHVVLRPLLPGYLFAAGDVPAAVLERCSGIHGRLRFGDQPGYLTEPEMVRLQTIARKQPAGWQVGDPIEVTGGPVRGLAGVIAAIRQHDVVVSVEVLGARREVRVRPDWVTRAE